MFCRGNVMYTLPVKYCKKCDKSSSEDWHPRVGWKPDCKYKTWDECRRNCRPPDPITPGGGGGQRPLGGCDPGPGPAHPGEGQQGAPAQPERRPNGEAGQLANTESGGGFAFRSSGGVAAKCACDSGFSWQKQGDHPCGCSEIRSATAGPASVAAMSGTATSTSGVAALGLESAAVRSSCSGTCSYPARLCIHAGMPPEDRTAMDIEYAGGLLYETWQLWLSPATVSVDIEAIDESGARCRGQWWEADSRGRVPQGYDRWHPQDWNNAVLHTASGGQWAARIAATERGNVTITDHIANPFRHGMALIHGQLVIWVNIRSGCDDRDDCCALITYWTGYQNADARTVSVYGPMCGKQCGVLPGDRPLHVEQHPWHRILQPVDMLIMDAQSALNGWPRHSLQVRRGASGWTRDPEVCSE